MEEKIIQEEPKRPKSSKKLQEKFKTLEQDWQSFTQSSSKTKPLKKCNIRGDFSSVQNQLQLLDGSPRHLMSSLQNPTRRFQTSPPFVSPVTVTMSGEVWCMRENELAKEEFRRDRKRAIESGELKGRRLFEDESEVGFDGGDEIQSFHGSTCADFDEREREQELLCFGALDKFEDREREVGVVEKELKGGKISKEENEEGFEENQSICSSDCGDRGRREAVNVEQGMLCFTGRCFCLEKSEDRERKAAVKVSEEKETGERKPGFGERSLLVKLCLVVVFVGIVSGIFGRFYGYGGEKVVLVPT